MRARSIQFLAALSGLLLAPATAFAADECKVGDFCLTIQGYYLIDFVAFVAILVWAGRKPIAAMLDKRFNDVAKDIAAAKELRDAAQSKYDEYRRRIDRLEEELARTMAEVRQGTELEVQRILGEAEAQVARITAEEAVRLAQESKRLRDELSREAALLALQLAEATVRKRLDVPGQQKLLDRALGNLENLPAPPAGGNG